MSTHGQDGPSGRPPRGDSWDELDTDGSLRRLREQRKQEHSRWDTFDAGTDALRSLSEEELRSLTSVILSRNTERRAVRDSQAGALEQRKPGKEIRTVVGGKVDIPLEMTEDGSPLEKEHSIVSPIIPIPVAGLTEQGKKTADEIAKMRIKLREQIMSRTHTLASHQTEAEQEIRELRDIADGVSVSDAPQTTSPGLLYENQPQSGGYSKQDVDTPLEPTAQTGGVSRKMPTDDKVLKNIPTLTEKVQVNVAAQPAPSEDFVSTYDLGLEPSPTTEQGSIRVPTEYAQSSTPEPVTIPVPLKSETKDESSLDTSSATTFQDTKVTNTFPAPLSHQHIEQQPKEPIVHLRNPNRPKRRIVPKLKEVLGRFKQWRNDKRIAKQREDAEYDAFLDDIDMTEVDKRLKSEDGARNPNTHTHEVDEEKEQPTAIHGVTLAMVQKNKFELVQEEEAIRKRREEEEARLVEEESRKKTKIAMDEWLNRQNEFAEKVYKKLEPEPEKNTKTLREKIKSGTSWLRRTTSKAETGKDSFSETIPGDGERAPQGSTPEQIQKEQRLLAGVTRLTENTHRIRKSTLERIGSKGVELLNAFDRAAHLLDQKTTAKQRLGLGIGISAAALGSVLLTTAPIIGATAVITVAGITVRTLTAASSYVAFKKLLDTMVKNQEAFDENRDDDDALQGFKIPETYKRMGAVAGALMAAALGQIVAEHVVPSLASYVEEHLPNLNNILVSMGVPSTADTVLTSPVAPPSSPVAGTPEISTDSVVSQGTTAPLATTPEVTAPPVTETIVTSFPPELLHHTVAPGENLWDILKHTLSESNYEGFNEIKDGLSKEQKILEMLGKVMEDPKSFGISSGNVNSIHPKEVLDFSNLFNK